ncbi:hypothetical protein A3K29_01080 [Candidatus Collierbacteria bacterium RIFOXYB2_FULL_46_14]|nr:MAG: hypothetical protein A3K29_01080 [Candidatus Collierbacteria bacterium RIFOXYB2_FULL_46_14]OGD75766.1 MAG: hypothetical protein A3K43_01080 [Candidatus Collierbacteria bacterium RIFOXYA2_FULL_46_20]OGD77102.1 MAG: hypothetical protein A3K39_01080 [Candidatus Collierbacteria bacterium RIFOXYC2_FULL_43_15]OGD80392.1 MAG: hypothetical protein A2320_01570 [Pseudomonadales bacterium GWC2_63_15]OGD81824.1 MAG: hypothetical protein A3K36_01080 [Candidatus Collierbacteria bacterium RIFOXYD2_FUL
MTTPKNKPSSSTFRKVIPEDIEAIEKVLEKSKDEGIIIVSVKMGRSGDGSLREVGNFEQLRHRGTSMGSDMGESDYDYTSCLVIQWNLRFRNENGSFCEKELNLGINCEDNTFVPTMTAKEFEEEIRKWLVSIFY